eukprot:754218-Hanusia_phi.AAC.3
MMECSVVTVKIHRAEGLLLSSRKSCALAAQACIRELGPDQKYQYGKSLWTQSCPPSSSPWYKAMDVSVSLIGLPVLLVLALVTIQQLILSVSDIHAADPADRFLGWSRHSINFCSKTSTGEVVLNVHQLSPSPSPIREKFRLKPSKYFKTSVYGQIEVSISYKPQPHSSPRIVLHESQSLASGASTKPADASTPLSMGTVVSKKDDWAWQVDDVKKRCSVRFEDEIESKKTSDGCATPDQPNMEPIEEVVKRPQQQSEMPWDILARLLKLDEIKLAV